MTVDTTTEAVERQRALLQKVIHRIAHRDDVTVLRIPADANHDADMICDAADKLLSALAGERDRLEKKRAAWARRALDGQRDVFEALRQRDAARAECVAMASQVTEAQAQVARMREALENMVGFYDTPVSWRRYPQDTDMKEACRIARTALTEAPRHD
jgi:hypothetical protein